MYVVLGGTSNLDHWTIIGNDEKNLTPNNCVESDYFYHR